MVKINEKVMQIFVLTSAHHRFDVRVYHKELLSLKQFKPKYIVLDGKGDEFTEEGIQIIDINKFGLNPRLRFNRFVIFQFLIIYFFLNKTGKFAIHFHDSECFLSLLVIKFFKSPKIIYDVHENLVEEIKTKNYLPNYIRNSVARLIEYLENLIARNSIGIITATPFLNEKFLNQNPNIVTVSNYPKIGNFPEIKPYTDRSSTKIVYVGLINEVRGIFEVMDYISGSDIGVEFHVAGPFADNKSKNRFLNHSNINRSIYHGILDREGVYKLLNDSTVGVLIGYPLENAIDSIPIKLFEYLQCGLPVIVSDYPKWKSFIEKNKLGIAVNPFSKEEFLNALHEILSNKSLAETFSTNGKKLVRETLNWELEETKLINFYEKLIC